MNSQPAVQDTYPPDFAECYGCGRNNKHGMQIKTYLVADETVTDHEPEPFHKAAGQFAYGGIVASLIDCHSTGSAAIFWMRERGQSIGVEPTPRFVTARLEVDYVAPTPLAPLHLVGTPLEIGERKVVVATELSAGGVVTARGQAVLVKIRT
ncbi:MAG: PaaI family thioesterase [bacterium]|nr:PaaI family thioesterase [bacterium]